MKFQRQTIKTISIWLKKCVAIKVVKDSAGNSKSNLFSEYISWQKHGFGDQSKVHTCTESGLHESINLFPSADSIGLLFALCYFHSVIFPKDFFRHLLTTMDCCSKRIFSWLLFSFRMLFNHVLFIYFKSEMRENIEKKRLLTKSTVLQVQRFFTTFYLSLF